MNLMKPIFIFLLIFRLSFSIVALGQNLNPAYDEKLANSLGADDYGLKPYVLVILKTGTNKTTDRAFIDSCFVGHMRNISEMVEQKKLIVAGPIAKNEKTYRGIFILNVATFDEANELLQKDAAIKEKILEPELFQWYGSAALPLYLDEADKIWKKQP